MKVNIKKTVMLSVLAVIALLSGVLIGLHLSKKSGFDEAQFHGTWLKHPRALQSFSLKRTDGRVFNNESLHGHWTMVFFGFTNCGYLCPTAMAEIGKMYRQLQAQGIENLPEVVMISIDPRRDNMGKLKSYVEAFNPHFSGARGNEKIISAMTREMGVAYIKVAVQEGQNPENYDMQHSGAIMLINPQGKLNAFFTTPHQADSLAADYEMLIR